MKSTKLKRIHVRPYHAEIRRYEGGFDWTFHDGNKRFVVHFPRWWLVYLASDLRKVLQEEEAEVKRLWSLTGFKDENQT